MKEGERNVPFLTAGDVKQFFYCPRIVFYRYLMPGFRFVTYKMKEGKLRQDEEAKLEKRRTLARFDIIDHSGRKNIAEDRMQRLFNVKLASQKMGISGILDMVIVTPAEVIPVDFKDGRFSVGEAVALHHKYQLLTYGLLLEEHYGVRARRGFVHSLEDGKTKAVYFTEGARKYLSGKLGKMRCMIENECLPDRTPYAVRCGECEFNPVCWG